MADRKHGTLAQPLVVPKLDLNELLLYPLPVSGFQTHTVTLACPGMGRCRHPTELDIAGFFEVHSQISPERAPQDGDKKEKIFYLMCQQKED